LTRDRAAAENRPTADPQGDDLQEFCALLNEIDRALAVALRYSAATFDLKTEPERERRVKSSLPPSGRAMRTMVARRQIVVILSAGRRVCTGFPL